MVLPVWDDVTIEAVLELAPWTAAALRVHAKALGLSVNDAVAEAVSVWALRQEAHADRRERLAVESAYKREQRAVDVRVLRDSALYRRSRR
jgi:hypothetical protein